MILTIRRLTKLILLIAGVSILVISCKKEPGQGGNSTVYGKVLVKDYNSTFTVLQETYYGPGVWVYIVYGDDRDYGDRIETSYDGTYEFKYMRPGSYTIYVYSKDSTLQTNAMVPVIREITVPKKKQDVEVQEMVIFN